MILLADIGGSKTRMAVSGDLQEFETPVIFSTPQEFEQGMDLLYSHATTLLQQRNLEALVVGIAGSLDGDLEMLVRAPHLPSWEGRSIVAELGRRFGVPVYVQNDSALGALGEAVHGAGRNSSIVAYVTVGTGVGGALVVDGVLARSAAGFEIGHQYLIIDGVPQELEDMVSGSAMLSRYGKPSEEITDETTWEEVTRNFSYGLRTTLLHWSPNKVVLGGSLFKEKGLSIPKIVNYLKSFPTILAIPEISHAELGDFGGLYGAMVYGKQKELGRSL